MKIISSVLPATFSLLILLGFSCSKTPSDPEEFGEKVLEAFAKDDFESFLEMTTSSLSQSQMEDVMNHLKEKNLEHWKKELEEETDEEEKESIQDNIKELEETNVEEIAVRAKNLFLRSTLEEVDYEEWKEIKEKGKDQSIDDYQKRILKSEREGEVPDYLTELLKETKKQTFGSKEYEEWKESLDSRKEKWKESFDDIVRDAKSAGINWEDVKFEYVDFDKEMKKDRGNYDMMLVFSYRDENYKIELDDCVDTQLGIMIGDEPKWKGSFSNSD